MAVVELDSGEQVTLVLHVEDNKSLAFDFASNKYVDYGEMRIYRDEVVTMISDRGEHLLKYLGIVHYPCVLVHRCSERHWTTHWMAMDETRAGMANIIGFRKRGMVLRETDGYLLKWKVVHEEA